MSNDKKGYWIRSEPENQIQVASQYGSDKVGSIVKSCIKDYIASFLDSEGSRRSFVTPAFPSMAMYLTDEYKHNVDKDPQKRELQLCSLYERVKEKLPCILLDDASTTYKNSGLGRIYSSTLIDKKTQFWFRSIRDVSVSLIVGANDVSTCSNIRDALAVMFGDISKFVCGNILTKSNDDTSSWEVILNSQPLEIGTLEKIPAGTGESANNLVYFSQSTVTCRFEGAFAMESPATQHQILDKMDSEMSLECPSEIEVGSTGILNIRNAKPFGLRVFSSNANIANLVKISESSFRILGRKKGTATIQLIDEDLSPTVQWSSFSRKIVLEKEITII